MAKLKVYRTPIGFHDAYVAATSQKAALKAWGADADLFGRGVAEVVTDPELMRAPLDRPGEVIRVKRGTDAQHLKALGRAPAAAKPRAIRKQPADEPAPRSSVAPVTDETRPRRKARARPKPSRAALERAEKAVAEAQQAFSDKLADIATRKRALDQEQHEAKAAFQERIARLEAAQEKALKQFSLRLEAWATAD